jgi:hypothetical protein
MRIAYISARANCHLVALVLLNCCDPWALLALLVRMYAFSLYGTATSWPLSCSIAVTFRSPISFSSLFCRRAYVSVRQRTSAYVLSLTDQLLLRVLQTRIRQRTSACVSMRQNSSAYVSMYSQHASAYVSVRQHLSGYVRIRQHLSAYVSIRMP